MASRAGEKKIGWSLLVAGIARGPPRPPPLRSCASLPRIRSPGGHVDDLEREGVDINNLVETKGSGKEDAKAFYKNVEKLDFAIRQKDKAAATAALAVVQAQGDTLIKSLA